HDGMHRRPLQRLPLEAGVPAVELRADPPPILLRIESCAARSPAFLRGPRFGQLYFSDVTVGALEHAPRLPLREPERRTGSALRAMGRGSRCWSYPRMPSATTSATR